MSAVAGLYAHPVVISATLGRTVLEIELDEMNQVIEELKGNPRHAEWAFEERERLRQALD